MKKAVKTLVLFTIILLIQHPAYAQLKPNPLNGIASDVKKVIEDYPAGLVNLIGELIVENPQSAEYQCNFTVHGAEESSITRYSSKAKSVYSWQALMLSTESFEKAKQKYRTLYNQLINLPVKPAGSKTYYLKGDYQAPAEEMKFASIIFAFSPADDTTKKLKAEISLQYELTEWKVKLLVYDKEREDNERGKAVEE